MEIEDWRIRIDEINDDSKDDKDNILPVGEFSKGCEGNEVKLIQKALQRLGYIINCTGRYNDTTVNRIKELQTLSGYLVVDGIYGKNTREYMIKRLETLHKEELIEKLRKYDKN